MKTEREQAIEAGVEALEHGLRAHEEQLARLTQRVFALETAREAGDVDVGEHAGKH